PAGGASDGFVATFSADGGTLNYSALLGGSAADRITGLALGAGSNIHVVGSTSSADLPLAGAVQTDLGTGTSAFVSVIEAGAAGLTFSSYLDGSSTSAAAAVAVDNSQAIYVTGQTIDGPFPTLNAVQDKRGGGTDAFLVKLTSGEGAYSTAISTYLGGEGFDGGQAVTVHPGGLVTVAGTTGSGTFPLVEALQTQLQGSSDAFVSTFAAD